MDTIRPRFKRVEPIYWWLTDVMLHALGRHEEELEVAREAHRRLPGDFSLQQNHLSALAALGKIDELEAQIDTFVALPGTNAGWPYWIVLDLRTHGFEWQWMALRGLAWLEARPPDEGQGAQFRRIFDRAYLLCMREQWEEARDLFEQLVGENETGQEILSRLAGALARLGDGERARAISVELASRVDEVQRSGLDAEGTETSYLLLGRARIAAALGEREQAVQFLEEGYRLTRHKGQYARDVRHELQDLLGDYLPFQQFVKPRG